MNICEAEVVSSVVPSLVGEAEFTAAYKKSLPKTFKFLQSLGANFETAEEIAQAAWVRGWQCREQLLQIQFLATWVNAIARNLYREHIVKSSLLRELDEYGISSNIQRSLEVKAIISHCTKPESHLLHLHYFEGYTSIEIAKTSNTNPATVRVRLLRLRENLRQRLSKAA